MGTALYTALELLLCSLIFFRLYGKVRNHDGQTNQFSWFKTFRIWQHWNSTTVFHPISVIDVVYIISAIGYVFVRLHIILMSKVKTSSSDPPVELTTLGRDDRRNTGCNMDCMKKKKLLWALIFLVICGVVVVLLETIFELQLFKANDVGKKMGDLLIDEDKGTDKLSILDNNIISKTVEIDEKHKSAESAATSEPEKSADKSAQMQEEASQEVVSKDRNGQRPVSAHESPDNRKRPQSINNKQQNEASAETDTRNKDNQSRAVPDQQAITEPSSDSFWLFEAICLAVSVSGYAFVKHRQRCIDRAFLAKVNRQIDGV